jgi:vancomycin resistance protein YoaR
MLAVFVGIIAFNCGILWGIPHGVTVNGINVGGLPYNVAVKKLREETDQKLKQRQLNIYADEQLYTFHFPEFNYTDNFDEVLRSVHKDNQYTAQVNCYLNGFNEVVDMICVNAEKQLVEPYVVFNKDGTFDYFAGSDGVTCDRAKLEADINNWLKGDEGDIKLSTQTTKRHCNMAHLKDITTPLCTFSTTFDSSNVGRTANIKLSAEKINGLKIEAGKEFSFNEIVGARTRENGFTQAKIIEEGRFVDGVGGGVCQVSTTIYNTAILSGLEITEFHAHSLGVSYVEPSRDAMVSGDYYDLKFKNNRLDPIYIGVNVKNDRITCTIYGESDGYDYEFESEVIEELEKPQPLIVYGNSDKVLSNGNGGKISCGYIIKRKGDQLEKIKIRTDKYSPTPSILQKSTY